jgi:hypothetical protein
MENVQSFISSLFGRTSSDENTNRNLPWKGNGVLPAVMVVNRVVMSKLDHVVTATHIGHLITIVSKLRMLIYV